MSSAVEGKIPRSARDDRRGGVDLSKPVLALVAALLAIMIVLPMGWLMVYAFATRDGQATLGNFVTLFTDPSFVDPLMATLVLSVSVSGICCLIAAPMGWLVARTDMPLARTVRTLVMASLVTPPFVGAVAWEMLAARIKARSPEFANMTERQVFEAMVAAETPLGGEQTPQDIGNLAVFYASDKARMITGQVVAVDGGISVK